MVLLPKVGSDVTISIHVPNTEWYLSYSDMQSSSRDMDEAQTLTLPARNSVVYRAFSQELLMMGITHLSSLPSGNQLNSGAH